VVTLRRRLLFPGLLVVLMAVPESAFSQAVTVAVDRENLRASPEGNLLAEVLRGTTLQLGPSRGPWREVTLEGWIWSPSVRDERRDGHDLVVAAPDGENLRDGPGGAMIARVRAGMRLQRLETRGNWVRVRRTAWIWAASIARDAPAPAVAEPAPAARPEPAPPGRREFATAGAGGLVILTQPAGDTIARVPRGATVEVLGREGGWTRVRIEGWMATGASPVADTDTAILRDIERAEILDNPERFRGRLVEWTIQFIALQQAERFRTDFTPGQYFMLARGPDEDVGFVYLAVPEQWLEDVRRLTPLERIRVLGRLRIPRSALTDAPILDLLDLSPATDTGTP
jgi:hypothetical protein